MKTRFLFLYLIICNCYLLSSQIPSYVPSGGLQCWWPFSGNANDQTAKAYISNVSGATLTADRFNNANSAYNFDGVNDFISTNYVGILGTSPRAVSVWALTTQSLNPMYIFGWGGNSNGSRFGLFLNDGSFSGASVGGGDCYMLHKTNPHIANGSWQHYVVQFNANIINQVQIWQNGALLTQTLSAYQPNLTLNTINTFSVHFGKINYSPEPAHFNGGIDDIGIWNRTLTSCEIKELYTGVKTNIFLNASSDTICRGQLVAITANGVDTYTWNTSSNSTSITVSPIATAIYSVNGTSTLTGCTVTKTIAIVVVDCTGLTEADANNSSVNIFPNPNNGSFCISAKNDTDLKIVNALGQIICEKKIMAKTKSDVSDLPYGIYFVTDLNSHWRQKIIVTK